MSNELAAEQTYITGLYERLDALRAAATQRLTSSALGDGPGGTQQARGERDANVAAYAEAIAQYNAVENGLCFGRLDFTDGERAYIGRIGIHDRDHGDGDPWPDTPLLMDWRAPAARPFYLATVAAPDGVHRRRHLRTHHRDVTGIDDEILTGTAATGTLTGHDGVTSHDTLANENALLAALTAGRTGQMSDIVETIQAEQDRIIRSGHDGILVVQGGPGTGKTAVALHRAAYLLYTHRAELGRRAVLIVGPNATFLRYIARVLPGLGENAVVLATVADLVPGISAKSVEPATVAEIKGRTAMVGILTRAIRDREQIPDDVWEVPFDRDVVHFTRELCGRVRDRVRRAGLPHNQAHPVFVTMMVDALARQIADRIGADVLGGANLLTDADIATIRDEIRDDPSVMSTIDELWPILTAEHLLADLWSQPDRLDSAAPGLTGTQRDLLYRPVGDAWTAADVPLIDEAAELLGADDSAAIEAEERARDTDVAYAEGVLTILSRDIEDDDEVLMAFDLIDAARLAERQTGSDGLSVAERAAADRQWAYGHVIVDEAQELSAMAWRALMRRVPSRSMTLVGDVAQTSDLAGTASWRDVLAPHVEDRWRLSELTVNYRTPAEIMDIAAGVLAEIDPGLRAPRSIRRAGIAPRTVHADDLTTALPPIVSRLLTDIGDGRVAVLAADPDIDLVAAALPGVAVGEDPDLAAQVVVLGVRQAKGLEFDAVVLVAPQRIVARSPRGRNDLYVALTRATRRLVIVEPSPERLPGTR